jgi:hypothetical protein
MEYIRKKYIILPKVILFFAILFLIAGCGPYIIKPDYENELYQSEELKRDKIKIVKVVDARTDYLPEKVAGTARVGLLNQFKVPYKLNTSVKDFVDQSIHKITGESIKEKFVNPITVYIDKFSVREDYNMIISGGYFNCDFRFCYPVTRDSFQTIEASSRKSTKNILDITGSLDELIYSGIFDCTKFFLKEFPISRHYQKILFIVYHQSVLMHPQITGQNNHISTHYQKILSMLYHQYVLMHPQTTGKNNLDVIKTASLHPWVFQQLFIIQKLCL